MCNTKDGFLCVLFPFGLFIHRMHECCVVIIVDARCLFAAAFFSSFCAQPNLIINSIQKLLMSWKTRLTRLISKFYSKGLWIFCFVLFPITKAAIFCFGKKIARVFCLSILRHFRHFMLIFCFWNNWRQTSGGVENMEIQIIFHHFFHRLSPGNYFSQKNKWKG